MELQPCACGAEGFDWSTHDLRRSGGRTLSAYGGTCAACGAVREFDFEIDADPPVPPAYGGQGPSRILDPGEFLHAGHRFARNVPPAPDQAAIDEQDDAYDAISMAVESVTEVLKFVPSGAGAVPVEAFTSPRGRRMYAEDAGQFGRDRLELELADYERIRRAYATALGG
jgi:hypothetical protein